MNKDGTGFRAAEKTKDTLKISLEIQVLLNGKIKYLLAYRTRFFKRKEQKKKKNSPLSHKQKLRNS